MRTRSRSYCDQLVLPADSALTLADYDRALHAVKHVDVIDVVSFLLGPDCAGFIGTCEPARASNDRRRLGAR